MKESGSKRSASSSPLRRTKRQRDAEQEKDSLDSSKKKSKDKTTRELSDEGDSKQRSRKKELPKDKNKSKSVKEHKKREDSSERSDRMDSRSGSESYSSDEAVDDNQPTTRGSRYWGGEADNPTLEEGELSNHSPDIDYEVGRRYYEDKYEGKNTEGTEVQPNVDYVVGKRYYEDKPETLAEDAEGDNASKKKETNSASTVPNRRAKLDDPLLSRTGGAYIPPAKLRLMQASITDKSSISYQRIAWEALKKSIHGHINKVNTSNIGIIARLLMKENIVRGRGLLCRSLLQAQAASPTFTNVYSCLVSVVNCRFPNIGELLMKRVILQFKRGFKRNDKALCIASCQFIAHLVNQQVAHEILALEMLTLLLESPTDDSVEVAVAFLKEVGQKLLELSPKGTNAIFDMLRNILHQGNLEKRVQYMIEVVFQVRKDGFRSFESIAENLDLVEEEDRYTHILTLDEAVDPEDLLNVFKHDPEYELNEDKYKALKEEIIGGSSSEEESGGEGSDEDSDQEGSEDDDDEETKESKSVTIIDETETNLVALRRTIYLTIQSSLDFEECCHKLLKMDIKPGQEPELCHMLLDCCAELRTYEKFFGLLAQRFCQINRVYIAPFEEMFAGSYATVHRLDTNKLRNVARFFGHLLFTDAISWQVLETVRLNEEDTTSSSRIFIKILFQELAEYMGLSALNQRLKDPTLQTAMEGLFPRDNPKNTRFAINFFTSIGLGGLTDELREHLKTQPKASAVAQLVEKLDISSDSSSSSSESSDDSSDSESSDDSSSDSEEEKKKNKKKKKDSTNSNKPNKKKDNAENQQKQAYKERSDDVKEKSSSYSDKRTKSNYEENRGRQDMKDSRKNYERYDRNKKNGKEETERKEEKRRENWDLPRDEKYEARDHKQKIGRERDNYKRDKRDDKDFHRKEHDKYEDKRKTHKEEIKGKSNSLREEDYKTNKDKENRKKENNRTKEDRDTGKVRDRREENRYREERGKKHLDTDTSRKNREGKSYEHESRHHRDKSDRRQR